MSIGTLLRRSSVSCDQFIGSPTTPARRHQPPSPPTPLVTRLEAPRPQAIVIFGASGDLTRRKIIPALYNLAAEELLPERHAIIGYAWAEWDDEAFRAHARRSVEEFSRTGLDEAVWKRFV